MLDIVLPLAVAVLGAAIAALPLYAAKRGARAPSGLRIGSVFLAIWGGRCIAYGITGAAVWRIAAGATALVAGALVFTLTLSPKKRVALAMLAAGLGAAHLALTVADVIFSRSP